MPKIIEKIRTTRLGFLTVLFGLIWFKTLFAYYMNFSLGVNGILQHILLVLNPLGITILLLGSSLYIKKPRRAYIFAYFIYLLMMVLLIANVLYYREFSDFMTVNTVMNAGAVSQGLGASTVNMLRLQDLVLFFDLLIVLPTYAVSGVLNLIRLSRHQKVHWPSFGFTLDTRPVTPRLPQAISVVALAVFAAIMSFGELNRPQLLTRTFDRNYIVKYLGLAPFSVYDGLKTAQTNQVRATAGPADMDKVLAYTRTHQASPNPAYYGVAKGKNVIVIHLESFQQFLIDFKVDGQEVTPFLNSLVRDQNTLSFDNFFHQVGLGKTSDAENMLETSTFGLPTGSLFSSLGSDNTFQAAPALLNQYAGYNSAVFHGGSGGFWNRNNTYKSLGYNYFFSGEYYGQDPNAKTEYGIKDKLMFAETPKYLEHLQQPFYTKIITTSNHYSFSIPQSDTDFPDAGTDDPTVNGYFRTAHYLDASLREFFNYLKASGLYDKSLIMLYGDHYGISNDRNKSLAPLLEQNEAAKPKTNLKNSDVPDAANSSSNEPGKDKAETKEWTALDNMNLQRVPLIFHAPGLKGGINHTYGGEIDVLPTLEHLLGLNTENFVQFGSDLLSPKHPSLVLFRNHNFVTPTHAKLGNTVYDTTTGAVITPDEALAQKLKKQQDQVDEVLNLSDTLAEKNLLRYYVPSQFTPINPANYDYGASLNNMLQAEKNAGRNSTSLYTSNNNRTTTTLYRTDAIEVLNDRTLITQYPESVRAQAESDGKGVQAGSK